MSILFKICYYKVYTRDMLLYVVIFKALQIFVGIAHKYVNIIFAYSTKKLPVF